MAPGRQWLMFGENGVCCCCCLVFFHFYPPDIGAYFQKKSWEKMWMEGMEIVIESWGTECAEWERMAWLGIGERDWHRDLALACSVGMEVRIGHIRTDMISSPSFPINYSKLCQKNVPSVPPTPKHRHQVGRCPLSAVGTPRHRHISMSKKSVKGATITCPSPVCA